MHIPVQYFNNSNKRNLAPICVLVFIVTTNIQYHYSNTIVTFKTHDMLLLTKYIAHFVHTALWKLSVVCFLTFLRYAVHDVEPVLGLFDQVIVPAFRGVVMLQKKC